MATDFNRGGPPDMEHLKARDLEGNDMWAIYPHDTKQFTNNDGTDSEVLVCEVWQIHQDGTAERHGAASFGQTRLSKLPIGQWSCGIMRGPNKFDQTAFSLDWPADYRTDAIEKAMLGLPSNPLEEKPF
jgi:hypothetical protein